MGVLLLTDKCDVCGEREQTMGGFISWDGSGTTSITRTCDECKALGFKEAKALQQKKRMERYGRLDYD